MNKTVKGAFAAGTAAVLLMGGAGSLAYWNAEVGGGSGTVNSGHLTIKSDDTGNWTLNGDPVTDLTKVLVVPGDQLKFAAAYDIGAKGDNLQATVALRDGTPTGGLSAPMDVTTSFLVDGQPTSKITDANDGDKLTVAVDIAFPFGNAADNSSQGQTLNLTDYAVTLTQTDASAN